MNHYLKKALLAFVISFAVQPSLASFEEGMAAYQRQDYVNAFKEWRPLAGQGDAIAQYYMGVLYANGQGVEQSYEEAANWYEKAAEQDYAEAQYSLGELYDQGKGVVRNSHFANDWYIKAAEMGHLKAKYILGEPHDKSQGTTREYRQAVDRCNAAFKKERLTAQFRSAGLLDETDQADTGNYQEAVDLCREAAAEAEYNQGVLIGSGKGIAQDYKAAASHYLKAAEQGHDEAQYNLGVFYTNGQGVAQDYIEADKWFIIAAVYGNAKATGSSARIEKTMAPEQIEAAQQRATVWMKHHKLLSNIPD